MQQPQPIAPAPMPHASPLQETTTEQTLRERLLSHVQSPPTTAAPANPTPAPPATTAAPSTTRENIDPAMTNQASQQQAQQAAEQAQQQLQAAIQQQQLQQAIQAQQQQQQQQPLQQAQAQVQQAQAAHAQAAHAQAQAQAQAQAMHAAHAAQQQQPPSQPVQPAIQPLMAHMPMPPQTPQHNIIPSPTMTPGQTMEQLSPGADDSEQPKARGGKRELSTSKRAAQNRAAQRAFRQRKEGYIKKLEEQVKEFTAMQENYRQIQSENYSLRNYIITIQSRLIDVQGEDGIPPAPDVLNNPTPALPLIDTSGSSPVVQPQAGPGRPPSVPVIGRPASVLVMPQHQVLQVPQGVPIAPASPHQQQQQQQQQQQPVLSEIMAAVGQKRPHDETDQAFLQSIAQAAGGPAAGFIPVQAAPQQPQQQQQQPTTPIPVQSPQKGKSQSPAAKRVKGEKAAEKEAMDTE